MRSRRPQGHHGFHFLEQIPGEAARACLLLPAAIGIRIGPAFGRQQHQQEPSPAQQAGCNAKRIHGETVEGVKDNQAGLPTEQTGGLAQRGRAFQVIAIRQQQAVIQLRQLLQLPQAEVAFALQGNQQSLTAVGEIAQQCFPINIRSHGG